MSGVNCSRVLLRKKAPPLGMSFGALYKKLRTPGAGKPWRRKPAIAGVIEVSPDFGIDAAPSGTMVSSQTPLHIPAAFQEAQREAATAAQISADPFGLRSPDSGVFGSSLTQVPESVADPLRALSSPATNTLGLSTGPYGETEQAALLFTGPGTDSPIRQLGSEATLPGVASVTPWQRSLGTSASSNNPSGQPLATIEAGSQLNLHIDKVTAFNEPTSITRLKDTRTKREIAESVRIPRHLNGLFHRIMGWSKEVGEPLDDRTGLVSLPGESAAVGIGVDPANRKQELSPKEEFTATKKKMQYGVLMAQQ